MIMVMMTILLFFSDGSFKADKHEVSVPECQTVNGVRTEDSTCGMKACIVMADAIAARDHPSVSFQVICRRE